MDPLPLDDCYDVGDYYDPDYYWLGMQVEIRSEPVEEAAPEAKEDGHIDEGTPGAMGNINHLSVVNYEGNINSVNCEGDINREGAVNQDGEGNHEVGDIVREPEQQLPEEPPQVAAAGAAVPQGKPKGVPRCRFTAFQVRELEKVFQRTQYLNAVTR